jgi:hypothetical protein
MWRPSSQGDLAVAAGRAAQLSEQLLQALETLGPASFM